METIHLAFRLLALSQGLLLIAYLLIYQRNKPGFLLLSLVVCFSAYLAQPLVLYQFGRGAGVAVLGGFATAIPAVLWLVVNRFFNDAVLIPIWFKVSAFAYLALWYTGELELFEPSVSDWQGIVFVLLPQAIKLGLVLHVVYLALAGRKDDLLDNRNRLRVPLATGGGLVTALVIVVELWAGNSMPMLMEVIGSVFMCAVALLANITLFRFREGIQYGLQPVPFKNPVREANLESETLTVIGQIENAMTEQRFYATYSATLADLAKELNLPAYRLRDVINRHMGFRNFNHFLNHYRIEEASTRLLQQPDLPVLSIALDVGFKSISSFNVAFKASRHKTPTAYRAANLSSD